MGSAFHGAPPSSQRFRVAISVLLLPINVVAFAIGYSTFIVSIVVETTCSSLRSARDTSTSGEHHG